MFLGKENIFICIQNISVYPLFTNVHLFFIFPHQGLLNFYYSFQLVVQLEVLVWWELQLFWVFSLKEDYSQQVRKTWCNYIWDQITYDSENNLSGRHKSFQWRQWYHLIFSKNVDPCFLEQLLLSNLLIIIWKKNCFMYIYIFLTLLVKILVAASIFYFKPIGP